MQNTVSQESNLGYNKNFKHSIQLESCLGEDTDYLVTQSIPERNEVQEVFGWKMHMVWFRAWTQGSLSFREMVYKGAADNTQIQKKTKF